MIPLVSEQYSFKIEIDAIAFFEQWKYINITTKRKCTL
tara:strand:+ start:173 stop:286 length:114 start_codon:yes stop_codon:yes gene_type:complete